MNEKIWLIDMGDDIVWCNEPDPSGHVEEEDTTGYVRMDIHQALEKENAELRITISNLRGEMAGNTCLMCNYLERADCYDQKTEQQATISLLCDALDEAATTINANVGGETKVKEYRALAKQHKQG